MDTILNLHQSMLNEGLYLNDVSHMYMYFQFLPFLHFFEMVNTTRPPSPLIDLICQETNVLIGFT